MSRRRTIGIVALAVSILLGIGAIVVTFNSFGSEATFTSPGTADVTLPAGKWTIFEQVPDESVTSISPSDLEAQRTVSVEQLQVVGPSGTVQLDCDYCTGKPIVAPVDLKVYNAIATFNVPSTGQYRIISTSAPSAQLAIADPTGGLTAVVPAVMVMSAASLLLFGLGLMWIITGKRRPQAQNETYAGWPGPDAAGPAAPGSSGDQVAQIAPHPESATTSPLSAQTPPVGAGPNPPAGWYPNPYLPGTTSEMWWDGKQWTSNWR